MKVNRKSYHVGLAGIFWLLLSVAAVGADAADPLPSWNEGPSKQSVLAFVQKVTTPGSPGFVPPAERIAAFDNDGALWAEQPMYFRVCN